MEQPAMNIRPEFIEGVPSETPEETKAGPDTRAVNRVVAGSAPGVRKKIRAGDGDQTGVGGHQVSIAILSHESHLGGMPNSMAERSVLIAVVARIFAPDGAQPSFHGVARRDSTQPHAVTVTEAFPMGAVGLWLVEKCAPSSAKQASGEAFRTNGTSHHPVNPLAGRDRLARVAAAARSSVV